MQRVISCIPGTLRRRKPSPFRPSIPQDQPNSYYRLLDINGDGVEIVGHQFFRLNGMEAELLEFAAYNKSTASWQDDWYGDVPLTEEEVNAITAKYPHVDQGMRPISELIG